MRGRHGDNSKMSGAGWKEGGKMMLNAVYGLVTRDCAKYGSAFETAFAERIQEEMQAQETAPKRLKRTARDPVGVYRDLRPPTLDELNESGLSVVGL